MNVPIVIAGGGLAGAATACLLARAGKKVLLLEREVRPVDKICGEFISVEAQGVLAGLGLDLMALGAQPIHRMRLVRGRSCVETNLPFRALGLSRRTLDEALLNLAAAAGAEILRGRTVNGVGSDIPISISVSGMAAIRTPTLFLATGKHDVRGGRRDPARDPEDLVGFKAYFRLTSEQHDALKGYVELMMWPDGYGGLQLVEGGRANLCLLTSRSRLQRAGGKWDQLFQDLCQSQPHLASRMNGAIALTRRPMSIFRAPFGFVHRPSDQDLPGLFRLGDQVGVIASFTGDGMSIALHSAALAAECYLQGLPSAAYHREVRRDVSRQIGQASFIYGLMAAEPSQAALMVIAGLWPGLLRLTASLTRIASPAPVYG